MTDRAPTAAEIQRIAELLAKHNWPGARSELKPYLEGEAPWELALRPVKLLLQQVVDDVERGHKMPIGARFTLNQFAGRYGTVTRGFLGNEPLDFVVKARVGRTDHETIKAAAEAQGISVTEFVRNAVILAAQKGTT